MVKRDKDGLPFLREDLFEKKVREYLRCCSGGEGDVKTPRRVPNAAGFCAYCRITGAEYRELARRYPRSWDIMQSALIDEAVNCKLLNSTSSLDYILSSVNCGSGGGDAPVLPEGSDWE